MPGQRRPVQVAPVTHRGSLNGRPGPVSPNQVWPPGGGGGVCPPAGGCGLGPPSGGGGGGGRIDRSFSGDRPVTPASVWMNALCAAFIASCIVWAASRTCPLCSSVRGLPNSASIRPMIGGGPCGLGPRSSGPTFWPRGAPAWSGGIARGGPAIPPGPGPRIGPPPPGAIAAKPRPTATLVARTATATTIAIRFINVSFLNFQVVRRTHRSHVLCVGRDARGNMENGCGRWGPPVEEDGADCKSISGKALSQCGHFAE
jgi:hypothetical protein